MRGLYVHVPFCAAKCRYCDFYSLPGRTSDISKYVDSVLKEAAGHNSLKFDTLFIGGGTPSVLVPEQFGRLLKGLKNTFDMNALAEATVEINPESASQGFLRAAAENGIDRISVGVQSLNENELTKSGRIHNAAQALEAIELARKTGINNISADLIIGLPGQTQASLKESIEKLVNTGIEHISVYCLSLEPGTPMAETPPPDLPDDEFQAEQFYFSRELLISHGFSHYEISNFARPGFECKHNLVYWHGEEYLGLGPAAASHLNGKRFKNRPSLDAYISDPKGQIEFDDPLNERHKAAEESVLRLRLLEEGIDPKIMAARYDPSVMAALIELMEKLTAFGMLDYDGTRFTIPTDRIMTSNAVFQHFFS